MVPPQGGTAGVQWLIASMENDIQTVPPSGGTLTLQPVVLEQAMCAL